MEEKKLTWSDAEKLVSELISDARAQAKRWFIAFLVTLAALFGTNVYWIHVLNSYEYVSQDGEGFNYYNSDVEGDIEKGTTD